MATVQERNERFRILFVYRGKRHHLGLGKVPCAEVEAKASQVDYLLLPIKQGFLKVPPDVTIEAFLLNDGQAPASKDAGPSEAVTFDKLRDAYLATLRVGSLEDNSLKTIEMHLRHWRKSLGAAFDLLKLTRDDIQAHINARKDRNPATLRKEVSSFRAICTWGSDGGRLAGAFPGKGLRYPKAEDKPPFLTFAEIERATVAGSGGAELWDALYLRKEEIDELLAFVRERATQPWVYPLLCAAAHTGARRSELVRIEIADVDFPGDSILIREKKRARGRRTTRRVSRTPLLKGVLADWLKVHPGGHPLFCHATEVARSKKRSRLTGHLSGKDRPTTAAGRAASLHERDLSEPGPRPLSRNEVHDHVKRTLAGSKWEVLKGTHVLRHSFISCLAAAGVDQRIIDDFVGHQTEEQRRRYRHLIPDVKQKAIAGVFG